jgi:transcriptional regulator with XRE-family HTH domain
VPRRSTPDPFTEKIGARLRILRQEAGLTLEQLAYQSELGSKGHLSDIEHGRVRPTVHSLVKLAALLEVDVLDLVTFPEASARQRLVDLTRRMKPSTIRRLIRECGG